MRALVVYESMFGNTRSVAEAVSEGLAVAGEVRVRSVGAVTAEDLADLDLLVLGAPTHALSLSRPGTRQGAAKQAAESAGQLRLEPEATGPGIREWLEGGGAAVDARTEVVCFDTRVSVPLGLSGSAAKAAGRRLRRQGHQTATDGVGFLVTKGNRLVDGELSRARAWGEALAARPGPV